jgi:hypothetical protein
MLKDGLAEKALQMILKTKQELDDFVDTLELLSKSTIQEKP